MRIVEKAIRLKAKNEKYLLAQNIGTISKNIFCYKYHKLTQILKFSFSTIQEKCFRTKNFPTIGIRAVTPLTRI